jgi:hypothetical protein
MLIRDIAAIEVLESGATGIEPKATTERLFNYARKEKLVSEVAW